MKLGLIQHYWNTSYGRVDFKATQTRFCFELSHTDGSIQEIKDMAMDKTLIPFLMRGGNASGLYAKVVKLSDASYKLYLNGRICGGMMPGRPSSSRHNPSASGSGGSGSSSAVPTFAMQTRFMERISELGFLLGDGSELEDVVRTSLESVCDVEGVLDHLPHGAMEKNAREILLKKRESESAESPSRRPNIFAPTLALGLLCEKTHRNKVEQAFCWGEHIRLVISHDRTEALIQIEDMYGTVNYAAMFRQSEAPEDATETISEDSGEEEMMDPMVHYLLDDGGFYKDDMSDDELADGLRERIGDVYKRISVERTTDKFVAGEMKFARKITVDVGNIKSVATFFAGFGGLFVNMKRFDTTLEMSNLMLAIAGDESRKEALEAAYEKASKIEFIFSMDGKNAQIKIINSRGTKIYNNTVAMRKWLKNKCVIL